MLLTTFSNKQLLKLVFASLFVKYPLLLALNFEETADEIYSWFRETDVDVINNLIEPYTPAMIVGAEDGEATLKKINDFIFTLSDLYNMRRSNDALVKQKMVEICNRLQKTKGPMFIQEHYNENDLRSKYFWNDTHLIYLYRMINITQQMWNKINLEHLVATGKLDISKIIL